MTDEQKLLPCPFCGGEAEIEQTGDDCQSTIYQCTECSCSLETGEEWGHGKRWNTRAPNREQIRLIKWLLSKDVWKCKLTDEEAQALLTAFNDRGTSN